MLKPLSERRAIGGTEYSQCVQVSPHRLPYLLNAIKKQTNLSNEGICQPPAQSRKQTWCREHLHNLTLGDS